MPERPSHPTESAEQQRAERIALLNDQLRTTGSGGRIMATQGVMAQGDAFFRDAFQMLRAFDTFTEDNDPYGEHDFGSFNLAGHKLFWKIDYYARAEDGRPDYHCGSEDPSDPIQTERVLTLMLAEEY